MHFFFFASLLPLLGSNAAAEIFADTTIMAMVVPTMEAQTMVSATHHLPPQDLPAMLLHLRIPPTRRRLIQRYNQLYLYYSIFFDLTSHSYSPSHLPQYAPTPTVPFPTYSPSSDPTYVSFD